MSEEEDVLSGVPQGTVLASVLFVMMISGRDMVRFSEEIYE